jgi:hypothetical protein
MQQPQAPQMQQPQQPVQAAEGGLMHLPMRPDMFSRNDYAQGGVVHFDKGGPIGSGIQEYLFGKPKDREEVKPTPVPDPANKPYDPEAIQEALKRRSAADDEARIKPLPPHNFVPGANNTDASGNPIKNPANSEPRILDESSNDPNRNIVMSGGPTGGINKETYAVAKPFFDKAMEYINKPVPKERTLEDTEKELRDRGLDKLPATDTTQLQKVIASYNQPRHWTDNLSLMKQDALRNPSGGFGSMDIGGSARALDTANSEKSKALLLKLEEIKNLDAKADFELRKGNYAAAAKDRDEAKKLKAEIEKSQGIVAGQVAQGTANFAKMPNMGGGLGGLGSLLKNTVGLSVQDLKYISEMAESFVESPNNRSPFWGYLPPELVTQLQSSNKNVRNHGMEELQKNMPLYMDNYKNDYLSGKSHVVKKELTKP